jgi:RND family efflux transporter MFP subunit
MKPIADPKQLPIARRLALPRFSILCLLGAALLTSLPATQAFSGSDPTLVTALPAVRTLELTGFTRALAQVRLVAEAAGRVESVNADIGQPIPADGTFALMDGTFIRLEIEQLAVEALRLEDQIAFARREVERHKELARQKNTSASQLDGLEQTLRGDTHALEAVGVRRRILEERLARTRIRAPAGWSVTARTVEPGQWVGEGEVVGAAADFSALLVPFALTPEQYAALSAAGEDHGEGIGDGIGGLQLRLLDLDRDKARQVPASLYRVNPGFDPDTRKVLVDLRIDAEVEPKRGGLRVGLSLALPERTGAVLLPAAAVDERYEEYWVTREDGTRVQVMRLGDAGDQGPGLLRLASPQVRAGDRFRLTED